MAERPRFQPGDFALNLLLRGIIGFALLLPYRWRVPAMGGLMAQVLGPLAGYRRRALANLALVWPDMPTAARQTVARRALNNVGRSLIENYSPRLFRRRLAGTTATGPGVAVLQSRAATGQSVILASGHYGNYEAARHVLAAQGLEIAALYRPMSNRYVNAHYVQTLAAVGAPIFARGRAGTTGFVRHLKSGGTMAMLFDLHVVNGSPIPFLGKPALTALSAAEMALRYDAPLIPFYATRGADGLGFAVVLDAPIPRDTALNMTRALTRSLESRIAARPDQWFWIHRRWK